MNDSVLQGKNLVDYYQTSYNPQFFEFDKFELEVNPDEDIDVYNKYTSERQRLEYSRCALSFSYFATKYAKVLHPKKGLVPFIMFKYQRRVIKEWENNRFNIISKFRQGGLTTLAEIWSLWRSLFKLDQQIMLLSKTDREAVAAGEIINRAVDNLPNWLKPQMGKWNDHHKQFMDTGCNIWFYTPEAARGRAITYLIVDEAAFIPEMEKHWRAMYPTLSTGGNCIIISTVNGLGNWYEETFHAAQEGRNKFHVIELDYWEHPDYHNDEWVKEQKAQLTEKGWLQEVMRNFLDSGETYIPANIIGELQTNTRNSYPKRRLFKKWLNAGSSDNSEEWESDGALWLWKEPADGHEYIIGGDSAEGVGDNGDNSCFQVFDNNTLEQVAEFYSNTVPPYIFAQIINEIGIYYNHALIVVENMNTGGAVLSNLQHNLYYDNIYFENAKSSKIGIKTTQGNRSVILEALQHRLMNGTIKIYSRRFVKELTTFIYNPSNQKVEARRGKHDDAIMATCLAVYVRDSVSREMPIMSSDETPKDINQLITLTYEEIKKEIMEGAPKNYFGEKKRDVFMTDEEEMSLGVVFDFKRRNAILSEFSW